MSMNKHMSTPTASASWSQPQHGESARDSGSDERSRGSFWGSAAAAAADLLLAAAALAALAGGAMAFL